MKVKVEDQQNLVRDVETNAILETNVTALQLHRNRRNVLAQKEEQILTLAERIEKLEALVNTLIKDKE